MTEYDENTPVSKTGATAPAPRAARPAPVKPQSEKPAAEKRLWLNITSLEEADVEELMDTLCYYEGETTVIFVKNGQKLVCSQKVKPDRALMAELSYFLKEDCIKLL